MLASRSEQSLWLKCRRGVGARFVCGGAIMSSRRSNLRCLLLLLPAVALSLLLCICVAFDELGEAMAYIHDNRGNPEAVYPPEK